MGSTEASRRVRVQLAGLVQGVGFRPFVYGLATGLELTGAVGNDADGVSIEVQGPTDVVDAFLARLITEAPRLAVVEAMHVSELRATGSEEFAIVASRATSHRDALVSADVATCDDCLAELWDPDDRRHRYAFLNCTNCGPRYTIVRDVPYDRSATTMAGFAMCADCEREYHDPADRRFHAQPTCCRVCGPTLRLVAAAGGRERRGDDVLRGVAGTRGGASHGDDALRGAASLLADGAVVAVKGLGGYHLAVDAANAQAAATLRARKHREDKPFAVMVADVDGARAVAHLDAVEEALLTGPERPIVLLPRRADAPIAPAVAPGNRSLGVMVAYTPLHHLLAAALGRPFVLTSGNVSDEPIAYRDADALDRLRGLADAFLTHDRPIHTRVDDSVVRLMGGRPTPLRRSRGSTPDPVRLPQPVSRPLLAVGAELKNTVCVARGRRAFLSQHLGDLENFETLQAFEAAIEHLTRLFDVRPEVVVHDLHPGYLSTQHAEAMALPRIGVQHHHAHIAACLADNADPGPVIGVAFDGTGYGDDATLWGGEFLIADTASYERVGHLAPLPLPGGAAAIREPWRMAAVYLDEAFGDAVPPLALRGRHRERWTPVVRAARAGINAPRTSSAGRLFDAVAAILGLRDAVTYEGQAAIELEQAAAPGAAGTYDAAVTGGPPWVVRGADLVAAVVEDLRAGRAVPDVAARFHAGVAAAVVEVCRRVRDHAGLGRVALSGGVFQNVRLVEQLTADLAALHFEVLTHRSVPPNDGGISLGQAVVAAARDSRSRTGT